MDTISQPTRMLRLPEVERVTGLRRNAIYQLGHTGGFPKPRKLTERASAWREDEIQAWIASRPVANPDSKAA